MFSSLHGHRHPKSDCGRGSITPIVISIKMVLYEVKNLWREKKNYTKIYRGTQDRGEKQRATSSQAIMGDFPGNHDLQIKSTSCPGG